MLITGILGFFFLIFFTDDYDVRGNLSIYELYYIAVTSSCFYIVDYFCHERLENLLDTLWTSDKAQMKFHFFFYLKKIM